MNLMTQSYQGNLTEKKNFNSIDIAKLVCAIMVVMIHVAPFGETDDICLIRYLNYGVQQYLARIAVPFFFVCSGFFCYRKTKLETFNIQQTKKTVSHFLKLYLIWTAVYFPLIFRKALKNEKGMLHAALIWLRDCIFVGSYTQLWYFPATIFAVVLISFFLYKRFSPKKMVILGIALYLIGLLAQSWFGLIEPLRELTPSLWIILKLVQKVIGTTRDGLFEGFLFVGIGMLFAFYDFKLSKKSALKGVIISMMLMFFEIILLKYFDFMRGQDMYLFLIPAAFFAFSFVSQVQLPDNPVYKTLRMLSSLIFYSHLWVKAVVNKLLCMISEPLSKTCLLFFVTLIVTVCGSLAVIKLSEYRKFRWLKFFYV